MSDSGLTGALYLGQLSMIDRVIDSLRHRRVNDQSAADFDVLRSRFVDLVRAYEGLDNQNQALRKSLQDLADKGAFAAAYLADLEKAKAALERENEQQRLKLLDVTSQLGVLRQINREQNPGAYGYR